MAYEGMKECVWYFVIVRSWIADDKMGAGAIVVIAERSVSRERVDDNNGLSKLILVGVVNVEGP